MNHSSYLKLFLAGSLIVSPLVPLQAQAEGSTEEAPVVETVDVTAPLAPVVSTPLHTSTSLVIEGEAGTTALIGINSKVYTRVVTEAGTAQFNMSPQSVGKRISVSLRDAAGNVSEATEVVVAVDPSARPATPKIGTVNNSARQIVVTGTPGAKVTLQVGAASYTARYDAKGVYRRATVALPIGTVIRATTVDAKGATSITRSTKVIKDGVAPARPRVAQSVTTTSTSVTGTAEAYATVYAQIGTKLYKAPVMSTGKFAIKIPTQKRGQAISLYAVDGAGNKGGTLKLGVQHALYNKFYRFPGPVTVHREVLNSYGEFRYAETFAPVFYGTPSKANMQFFLNIESEDGFLEMDTLRLKVGSKSYKVNLDQDDVEYIEYEDGTVAEYVEFKPDAKLVQFVKANVRPENRIVVSIEGSEDVIEWPLYAPEKRAFMESLSFVGY